MSLPSFRRTLLCISIVVTAVPFLGGCRVLFGIEGEAFPERLGLYESVDASPHDTLIVLERTMCFGSCPVYEVAINGNGTVLYNGMWNVERKGIARATIDPDSVQTLLQAIEEVGYFSMPTFPPCPRFFTDMPSARTAIRLDDRMNRVDHYHGCMGWGKSDKMTWLENEIGRLVGTGDWVGSVGENWEEEELGLILGGSLGLGSAPTSSGHAIAFRTITGFERGADRYYLRVGLTGHGGMEAATESIAEYAFLYGRAIPISDNIIAQVGAGGGVAENMSEQASFALAPALSFEAALEYTLSEQLRLGVVGSASVNTIRNVYGISAGITFIQDLP